MEAWLVVGNVGARFELSGERAAVLGKAPTNDIVIAADPAVSRVHLVVEPVGATWAVTDLGSRNGTFLNGERLVGKQVLRDGDEIRAGTTTLSFELRGGAADASATSPAAPAPTITPREREFLVALCRPILAGSMMSPPASVREIAAALFVSESAVKKALGRLYDKFGLYDTDRRRGKLAGEAVRRGAVGVRDL